MNIIQELWQLLNIRNIEFADDWIFGTMLEPSNH